MKLFAYEMKRYFYDHNKNMSFLPNLTMTDSIVQYLNHTKMGDLGSDLKILTNLETNKLSMLEKHVARFVQDGLTSVS